MKKLCHKEEKNPSFNLDNTFEVLFHCSKCHGFSYEILLGTNINIMGLTIT